MTNAPQIAWCCRLTAAVAAALALWSAPSAHATPPTIDSAGVEEGRQLLVIWKLPPGMKNYIVEAATSPHVNPDGPEKGFFPASTRASLSITVNSPQTYWISPDQLPSGTYYVHVGAYDGTACPGLPVGCEIEFSEVSQVVVPLLPPVITSATSAQRGVRVEWTLPVGMASLFAEVATSPHVYSTGPLQGQFLTENVVTSRQLSTETTYQSSVLPFGTYYAHVGARDLIACSIDDGRPCPIAVSAPVAVVVPPNSPVLRSVDLSDHLKATWTLPPDMVSDYIEVATSPEVYADGEFKGEFLAENTVFFDVLFDWERSYESPEPLGLGPGTYWVHVGGNVRYTSLFEASDPVAFTIPGPPAPPPAAPALAQAPATEANVVPSFTLRVAGRQSVRKLVVNAVAKQAGMLTASGTIPLPGRARAIRLRRTSVPAPAGARVRLRLRLSRRDLRIVRSVLRRKRLKATITITARNESGNARSVKRVVRLKR